MKTKILLLTALLMAATTSVTAGNDDTLKVFRVHFSSKLDAVRLSGYSKVEIVQDSVEYLEYCDPSVTEPPQGLTYSVVGQNKNSLKLDTPMGCPKLRLHLLMKASNAIYTEDYAQVVVVCPANLAKMTVSAEDYSKVNIIASPGIDTVCVQKISLKAKDYSMVSMEVPCTVDRISLMATEYANVKVAFCKGDKLTSYEQAYSHVAVASFQMVQTVFSAVIEDEEIIETEREQIADLTASRNEKRNSHTNGFRFDYLWGFHNWGATPFNGLMGMKDGYALTTTFSSYQLEGVYYPYVGRHWYLGVGLGYASDVYHFTSDHVALATAPDGTATFDPIPPTDEYRYSTRLVARYIELPLMVRWSPSVGSNFFIGLAAIPGLTINGPHTGMKYKAESPMGKYSGRASASEVFNPFRLDARLSVGWQYFYLFAQVSALPVNTQMDRQVYPFKLGLAVSLGDFGY